MGVRALRGVEQDFGSGDVHQGAPVVRTAEQKFLSVVHNLAVIQMVAPAFGQAKLGGESPYIQAPYYCFRVNVADQIGIDHIDHIVPAEYKHCGLAFRCCSGHISAAPGKGNLIREGRGQLVSTVCSDSNLNAFRECDRSTEYRHFTAGTAAVKGLREIYCYLRGGCTADGRV